MNFNLNFLGQVLKNSILNIDINKLNEIRFRVNNPIIVKFNFKKYYLSQKGLTNNLKNSLICDSTTINTIIENVTEGSLYAHNDRIKNGYLITKDGLRIGIAGECVYDNTLLTIKNITSLLIRFPCTKILLDKKIKDILNSCKLPNILIISPPGFGKTTLIKAIINYINSFNQDILVIDERGELFSQTINADYIRFSSKTYAFSKGIRSLSPSVIITDELISEEDFDFISKTINSGIKIIASMHANEEVLNSKDKLLFINLFDYVIILNNKERAGEIKYIYDTHNRLKIE